MSYRVGVMYLGKIVEYGDTETIFQNPLPPYTRALISASILTLPEDETEDFQHIITSGEMPSPINPPSGCRFHTRCPEASENCSQDVPKMITIGIQQVKCHHYE